MIARLPEAIRRSVTRERLVVLLIGTPVLLVHSVSYELGHPFWQDETWVALTTRYPVSALPAVTSSTPIGWSFLLRLVPFGGDQALRMVPLAFAGASVVAGYWLVRRLPWPDPPVAVGAGLLAAGAVLFSPAMLTRDDLKQYTADAFVALLILGFVSALERAWSRGALVVLGVSIGVGMLFSHTAAFVGVAAFTSVALVTLVRRQWQRLVEAFVAGTATAVVMLAVYLAFDKRAVVPELTSYWHSFYVPRDGGLSAIRHFFYVRVDATGWVFGLGPVWLAVPLVVAGVVTIFRLGRPMTALSFVMLWLAMVVLSAAKRYPFLDHRTSTFLFTSTTLVAAVGVAGICVVLRRWIRAPGAALLAALTLAGFVINASPSLRSHDVPTEYMRYQTQYVAAHRAADDVVVVNLASNWGFAYYWPQSGVARTSSTVVVQKYRAVFPDRPQIVMASNKGRTAIHDALKRAVALAREHPGAKLWFVRGHMKKPEIAAWRAEERAAGLHLTTVGGHQLAVAPVG